MTRTLSIVLAFIGLLWMAAVAYFALQSWPHLPMDVSHTDPGTLEAYDNAVLAHALRYGALALLPALAAFALAWRIGR